MQRFVIWAWIFRAGGAVRKVHRTIFPARPDPIFYGTSVPSLTLATYFP
jgi:hypothetical protein